MRQRCSSVGQSGTGECVPLYRVGDSSSPIAAMGRFGLNQTQKELYENWQLCRRKSYVCSGGMSEGVPIQEEWKTFEGFVKDNWIRYLRAKIKWLRYKRVAPRDSNVGKLKLRATRLTRKVKAYGFTKDNTVFTSPSDAMKYHATTHKYMFEDQMLGTRDIKNILKKRGIEMGMEQITARLRKGFSLFEPSVRYPVKWKGVYRSYSEIALMENVSYDLLKKRIHKHGMTFQQSLDYCRNYHKIHGYQYRKHKKKTA